MDKKPSIAWYLLPLLLSIIGGLIGYFALRNKDKSMAKNMFYVGSVMLLAPFVFAFIFGTTPTPEQTSTQTGYSTLITKTPSEIGLKIDDLSAGWRGGGNGNDTYYSSTFDKERIGITHIVESKITKYSTIDEAKRVFLRLKNDNSDFKLDSVGLGDESFGWEYGRESTVVFRKANIVIETWYGKEVGTGGVGDAKEYAEIIEKKI